MTKKIHNHAIDLDSQTQEQFKSCYSEPFVLSSALMPDAHSGYVAPIGSVFITSGFVVPAWVGYDIGCGVIAIRISSKNILEKIQKNKDKIFKEINSAIPIGLSKYSSEENISEKTKLQFENLLNQLKEKPHDKSIFQYIKSVGLRNLGTLGSGNHFIELDYDKGSKDSAWLVIHSGSRGLGHKVAKKYMIKSSQSQSDFETTAPLDIKSQLGKEYLAILDFCLEYALLNRLEMANTFLSVLQKTLKIKIKSQLWVNKNHNHAVPWKKSKTKFIHRKGATPAEKNERGVIPGNMRDGSFLVLGLGNPKFLNSSTHGAGRAMSRTQARQLISLPEFKSEMKGITANVSQSTLDEAPMAYKDIFKVMKAQEKSVKIYKHLLPLINWKGESSRAPIEINTFSN